ncbi:MAG: glycosyltransferase family 4 protein [Novosphingobium sp.]
MKILHIAAHLGGGVGKAHAALCAADGADVQRHYLLLEEPRDRRYATAIERAGGTITVAPDPAIARDLVAQADVLQIEWWNHPRLYECLCRWDLPAARSVIWGHISGLHTPCIPAGLLTAPHRFLFTSACSMEAATVQALAPEDRAGLGVVNSGFGFATPAPATPQQAGNIGYLGTVDFSKLSPDFFEVVDRAEPDTPVSIWGEVEAGSPVLRRASTMRKPEAVRFAGHTDDPEEVLRQTGIFLYLLQPEHFGTAENALIEAMSLGCAPLVFANPAERAIVEHGRTGFIEADAPAAAERLKWMLRNPDMVARIGEAAARFMAKTRTAAKSAGEFAAIYRDVVSVEKRKIDYSAILGATPAEWFLSTQESTGSQKEPKGSARKGTLAHFTHCFPDDPSLKALSPRLPDLFSTD